jgi:hypothetical protein
MSIKLMPTDLHIASGCKSVGRETPYYSDNFLSINDTI